MNQAEFLQRLCEARHPLERGLRLEEHLRNGGGSNATATIQAVLTRWERVAHAEEFGKVRGIAPDKILAVQAIVLYKLDQVLLTTDHGSSTRAAAIVQALQGLASELERSVFLAMLLARRSGPLAECLYVTSGTERFGPEAFEKNGLIQLLTA